MPKMKLLLILLAVSLLANVALLARTQSAPKEPDKAFSAAVFNVHKAQLDAVIRSLPDDRRKALRADMAKDFSQLREYAETAGKERAGLRQALLESTVDTKAVDAHLDAIRLAQNASSELAQRMLGAILPKLSLEERKAVFQRKRREPASTPDRAEEAPAKTEKHRKPPSREPKQR